MEAPLTAWLPLAHVLLPSPNHSGNQESAPPACHGQVDRGLSSLEVSSSQMYQVDNQIVVTRSSIQTEK